MEKWFDIGTLDAVPVRGARTVATPLGDVAIFRTATGGVFALVDRCPHKGGPLSKGIVHGDSVACPLHNWVIDLETGVARAPDEGCARKLGVRVEDGRLQLRLPAVLAQAA